MSQTAPINAIVYQARNLLNGHRYIGFTTQGLEKRHNQHLKSAKGQQQKYRFQRAMAKYGIENFIFGILGEFGDDEELAKVYEIEAIAAYKPEYNMSYGGDGGSLSAEVKAKISAGKLGKSVNKGVPKSVETKRRMSAAATGKKRPWAAFKSEETRRKTSASLMGHPNYWHGIQGEEARAKIRAANQGKLVSEATRAKLRAYAPWIKWRHHSEETKQKMSAAKKLAHANRSPEYTEKLRVAAAAMNERNKIAVICLTDGLVFDSASAAATFYGVGRSSIIAVTNGRRPALRGMVFAKYKAPK